MTIEADEKPTFTQEDLAEIETDGGDDKDEGAPTGGAGDKGKASGDDGKAAKNEDGKSPKTIATGADTEAEAKAKEEADAKQPPKSDWPTNWREKLAEHYAAGDKKRYNQEIKRLQRITDPVGVYGMYRELEGKFTSGGMVKVPGKDAKPEDVAEFHKAIGVPEKPDDYLKEVKLENGALIGDADKPMLGEFASAMHKAGAPKNVMNAALNWYYQRQETMAAEMDEADDKFRRESEAALKEELGPAFKRQTNAIATLFSTAPGGADAKNPNSLYARLVGGRTADGRLIGNDPEVMRWLISVASDVNPIATVVEDGAAGVKSAEKELEELRAMRKTDKRKYYSDPVQKREQELISALEKAQAR
jgi:hypothetical protein